MGILDRQPAQGSKSTTATEGKREERKPSQIWLNIGCNVELDGETTFVSLPQGLAIDDMKQSKVKGGTEYSQLMQCKNGLLEEVQKLGSSLAPGERRTIALEVEIYRVSEEQSATGNANENPLLKAMFKQLSQPK